MIEKMQSPFTFPTNLTINVNRVIIGQVKNTETKQLEPVQYFYELEQHLRLYTSVVKRKHIFQLPEKARDLYLVMLYHQNDGEDYSILSYEKVNKLYKDTHDSSDGRPYKDMNLRAFKEAITSLVKANIIDLKDRKLEQYWINPNYFFQGNRVNKWPQNLFVIKTEDRRNGFDKSLTASIKI